MRPVKKASTNQSVVIRIIDSTAGTPENGVEHDTGGIDLWYRREGATKTSIVEVALAALDTAHTDGGIELIGDGYYRLDPPDAAFATGCNGVMFGGTVTGMIVIGCYIPLVDYDPYDTVRMGMTALPNAAADAAGGLPLSDAGALDLDALNTAAVRLTAARAQAIDDWINGGRLDLLLDAIPTTAMRGTDNAALASVCTEARLVELAAANIPTDLSTIAAYVDELESRLTAARAGYLDELGAANIPADIDILLTRITAAVALASSLSTHDTDVKALLPAALVGGRMSSDAVAVSGSTDAADKLEASAETIIPASVNDAGATTTTFITNLTSAVDDFYNGRVLIFTDGALAYQATAIEDYNGTTKAVTVTALTAAPSNGVGFVIV